MDEEMEGDEIEAILIDDIPPFRLKSKTDRVRGNPQPGAQ
jgi:hypothetical protein